MLQRCALSSSPGEDEISYAMLQLLDPCSLMHLACLYNLCLLSGNIPQPWCTALVRPIYKGNAHMDPTGTSNVDRYRGISLGSCMGKLLEKAVARRIEAFLGLASPFQETQGGFRSKRDSITQVWTLTEVLGMRGANALVIFFDLVKAFTHFTIAE